jgi:transposase-like protein
VDNRRRIYQEEVRRGIVGEIEGGRMSIIEASREYGISKSLIGVWLQEYGKYRPKKDIVEVVMKSERERIAELEKALADATLKARIYEELIKEADKEYKIDIKKTFGTGLSEVLGEKGGKSKRRVQHSK